MLDVVKVLSDLISFPSVNDPVRGVKPSYDIVKYIYEFLSSYGIEVKVLESNGYYSVFGSVGSGEPYVMLLAHYDVVPADASRWSYDPFKPTLVNGRLYGRGALDDKSNVAAMMVSLVELSRLRLNRRVLFAFTGDEEVGGEYGALHILNRLVSEGSLPKYLVNGDGANHVVICRRRKIFEVVVEVPKESEVVRGKKGIKTFSAYYPVSQHAHAAYFIPSVDSHPLVCASILIKELGAYVTSIDGKFLKSNVIPSTVTVEYVVPEALGDEVRVDLGLTKLVKAVSTLVRTPIPVKAFSEFGISITPNMYVSDAYKHTLVLDVRAMTTKELLYQAFNEVVNELIPEAKVDVRTDVGGFVNTPKNSRLVNVFTEVLNNLGVKYSVGEGAGASDSRFFTPYNVEVVDFGAVGGGMHGDDEYVDVESLKTLPKIYSEVVKKLLLG
jgi:succinyl-diaminopimelate desuccinylase